MKLFLLSLVGVVFAFSFVAAAEPCRNCSPARPVVLTPRFPRLFKLIHPDAKEVPPAKKDAPKKDAPKKKAAADTFRPLTAKEFPIAETLLAGPPPPPLDAMIGHTYQWHVNDQGELLYKRVFPARVIRAEFVSPK